MTVRPAKTQISLGIRPVRSESSLSAWRNPRPLATHWVHSEYSDQSRWMPRLIRVFAGRRVALLVSSCHGSFCDKIFPLRVTRLVQNWVHVNGYLPSYLEIINEYWFLNCLWSEDSISLLICMAKNIFKYYRIESQKNSYFIDSSVIAEHEDGRMRVGGQTKIEALDQSTKLTTARQLMPRHMSFSVSL